MNSNPTDFLDPKANINRLWTCTQTAFQSESVLLPKQLNHYEPRKTDSSGRRGSSSKYRFCVLWGTHFFPGASKHRKQIFWRQYNYCSFSKSSTCILQSQPRHYSICKKKQRDCCMYFPKYSNLTNLKKTDVIFHSPAQYKMSPILIQSKKFSCDCKHLGKMRRWHNTLKALQKNTRKSPPGHGRIKKFSSVQKERKKAVINVALQLPDIQTASSYSLIL